MPLTVHKLSLPLPRFEGIFGPWQAPERGVYLINPRTRRLELRSRMSEADLALIEARKRSPSTRLYIMRDIEPFVHGYGPWARVINGRADEREFLKESGLVHFDEGIKRPDTTIRPDDVAEVARRVFEMDELDIPPPDGPNAYLDMDLEGLV